MKLKTGDLVNSRLLVLVSFIVFAGLMIPKINAQTRQTFTVWTDKSQYVPGETGTLHFVLFNSGKIDMSVQRITIVFQLWQAYIDGQWEGSQIIEVNKVVEPNTVYENSVEFTVPSDGRAKTTSVGITAETAVLSLYPKYTYDSVVVADAPRYMDQIVTLFTIQQILIIVATVVIAATLFLSSRRPSVVWKSEDSQ